MQTRKQTKILSVWKKDDLLRLLAAIDRGNPSGKRDYDIILLGAVDVLRGIIEQHDLV
ncbi:hypothetical protein [Photorhabdus akhurstii]|uniref:hypothetical protein n=1 Tax=Photorhabdus akhurstii TaxID=171438 RepID=UPI001364C9EF|nr:hypothetical protein [Photorhabdus akhurstii]